MLLKLNFSAGKTSIETPVSQEKASSPYLENKQSFYRVVLVNQTSEVIVFKTTKCALNRTIKFQNYTRNIRIKSCAPGMKKCLTKSSVYLHAKLSSEGFKFPIFFYHVQ